MRKWWLDLLVELLEFVHCGSRQFWTRIWLYGCWLWWWQAIERLSCQERRQGRCTASSGFFGPAGATSRPPAGIARAWQHLLATTIPRPEPPFDPYTPFPLLSHLHHPRNDDTIYLPCYYRKLKRRTFPHWATCVPLYNGSLYNFVMLMIHLWALNSHNPIHKPIYTPPTKGTDMLQDKQFPLI